LSVALLTCERSVEFPDVPVSTQLRYLPPIIAPPHEWSTSKTASLTQLLPVAEAYKSPRRTSGTPAPLKIMKPMSAAPAPVFAPSFKRTTLDVKIPGAYIDYQPGLENLKKAIEPVQPPEPRQSKPQQQPPVRMPSGEFEMRYAPSALDSRSRYRQHKRFQPSSAYSGSDSAVFMDAVKVQYVKPSKSITPVRDKPNSTGMRRFKPLTLGDISPELGIFWE
jgi:hypothetical protein